jgi:hypothetical protein
VKDASTAVARSLVGVLALSWVVGLCPVASAAAESVVIRLSTRSITTHEGIASDLVAAVKESSLPSELYVELRSPVDAATHLALEKLGINLRSPVATQVYRATIAPHADLGAAHRYLYWAERVQPDDKIAAPLLQSNHDASQQKAVVVWGQEGIGAKHFERFLRNNGVTVEASVDGQWRVNGSIATLRKIAKNPDVSRIEPAPTGDLNLLGPTK